MTCQHTYVNTHPQMKLNDTHTRYIRRSSDDSASPAGLAPPPTFSRRFDVVAFANSSDVVRAACRARSPVAGSAVGVSVSVPGPEFESDPDPIVAVVVFFFVVDADDLATTGAKSPRSNASFETSRDGSPSFSWDVSSGNGSPQRVFL